MNYTIDEAKKDLEFFGCGYMEDCGSNNFDEILHKVYDSINNEQSAFKIDVFDVNNKQLENGDIFRNTTEDTNLNDSMCLLWIPHQMRFKIVYLDKLKEFLNPVTIEDVFRENYFLQSESFEIIDNFYKSEETKHEQLVFEF